MLFLHLALFILDIQCLLYNIYNIYTHSVQNTTNDCILCWQPTNPEKRRNKQNESKSINHKVGSYTEVVAYGTFVCISFPKYSWDSPTYGHLDKTLFELYILVSGQLQLQTLFLFPEDVRLQEF